VVPTAESNIAFYSPGAMSSGEWNTTFPST